MVDSREALIWQERVENVFCAYSPADGARYILSKREGDQAWNLSLLGENVPCKSREDGERLAEKLERKRPK
jgi:hypothetical protein